ncbi:MAG: Gfo/Idh/MocA family oxidoreductase [Planctomycetota bacterium]|nr:Gfo/Idh/MocA family oxidoreductase [Planctomycetota bacterium]
MRIAFIGGNGHHKLAGALRDEAALPGPHEVAVAGDGCNDEAARRLHAGMTRDAAGAKWFDDARAMFDAFKPEAVSVGAVYAKNGDWVAAALERDLPVISDKPIAATAEQLQRLERLSRANPKRVIVTEFEYRSQAAFRAARDAVADGRLGQLVLATAQKSYRFSADGNAGPGARPAWYADRSLYGGTILWVASHAIDAVRFTTGLRVRAVAGAQGNLGKPAFGSMEDHTISLLQLEGGVHAVVHADYCRPAKAATHGDDRLRLAGSKGLLEIRDGRCKLTTHDAPEADITDQASPLPGHREMLAGLLGQDDSLYGTAASLEMARVLLAARAAADSPNWMPVVE